MCASGNVGPVWRNVRVAIENALDCRARGGVRPWLGGCVAPALALVRGSLTQEIDAGAVGGIAPQRSPSGSCRPALGLEVLDGRSTLLASSSPRKPCG